MFFISSGALRVETPTGPVLLGSGDFFGELALLDGQPRNATVVAAGFADLLELGAEAFQAALAEDAALREAVEAAAATRRGA
jgi:CPA1 family monovalent cation:H+ antiporter